MPRVPVERAEIVDVPATLPVQLEVAPDAPTEVVPEISELAGRQCLAGHANTSVAKFCSECGQSLDAAPVSQSFAVAQASRIVARPKPDGLLTPEERAERLRLHAEAVRRGSENPDPQFVPPSGQNPVEVVHIKQDGFTFAGVVWMRGQELHFEKGSRRWAEAQSWLYLDERQQMERYNGRVMFGRGPWPGLKSYAASAEFQPLRRLDDKGELAGPSLEELLKADVVERRRRGGVPAPMG